MNSIDRRQFVKLSSAAIGGLALGELAAFTGAESTTPYNVLLIITDQQRFDSLRCAGNPFIETPNIDRLAKEGTMFTNAFTACPVCVPNRASILSGNYLTVTEIGSDKTAEFLTNSIIGQPYEMQKTFDEVLLDNGYRTQYFGKWHNPLEKTAAYANQNKIANTTQNLFAQYQQYLKMKISEPVKPGLQEEVLLSSKLPYWPDIADAAVHKSDATTMYSQSGRVRLESDFSLTAMIAKQTIKGIQQPGQPFAITCSFFAPHPPFVLNDPYYGMYPAEMMQVYASNKDTHYNSPYSKHDGRRSFMMKNEIVKQMMSNYYGLVTELDYWVGQIYMALEDINVVDQTLIIFTSDHGEMLGAHGMQGKANFYQEAIRIPLIMRLPGVIPANKKLDSYVVQTDICPTILDLTLSMQYSCNGSSLKKQMTEKTTADDQVAYLQWSPDGFPTDCIIWNNWKFMMRDFSRPKSVGAFYNLEEDPAEMNNLLASGTVDKKVKPYFDKMKQMLVAKYELYNPRQLPDLKEALANM